MNIGARLKTRGSRWDAAYNADVRDISGQLLRRAQASRLKYRANRQKQTRIWRVKVKSGAQGYVSERANSGAKDACAGISYRAPRAFASIFKGYRLLRHRLQTNVF